MNKPILVISKYTGEIEQIFTYMDQVKEFSGLSEKQIQEHVRNKRNGDGEYLYLRQSDYTGNYDFTDRTNKPIIAHYEDGSIVWFGTVKQFCHLTGYYRTNVNKLIKSKKGIPSKKIVRIEYEKDLEHVRQLMLLGMKKAE